MWCYATIKENSEEDVVKTTSGTKRTLNAGTGSMSSAKVAKKIADVEDIVIKLGDKHGSSYTVEKLNA